MRTIALDLDGVLLKYDGWKGHTHLGEPIRGAVEFTRKLKLLGRVMIYTTRCSRDNHPDEAEFIESCRLVKEALDRYGFHYDEIYTGIGKTLFAACIDDRNVSCVPENDPLEYGRALERAKQLIEAVK